MEAVVAGVKDSMMGGPCCWAPLVDVDVTLDLVETFDKDSNPQALRIAAGTGCSNLPFEMQVVVKCNPHENRGVVVPGSMLEVYWAIFNLSMFRDLRSSSQHGFHFYWVNVR